MKMQEEYGDDLQVIFVEVQGADRDKLVSTMLDRKWMWSDAIWTTERVFSTGMNGIPNYALLDSNGAVAMSGYSNRSGKAAEEKIGELVKLRRKGRKDIPKSVAKVEVHLNSGRYDKALVGISKLLAKPGSKETEAVLAGAKELEARVQRELSMAFSQFEWMLANGHPLEAEELLDALGPQLEKNPEYSETISAMKGSLSSPENKLELKAAKSLLKLEKEVSEDGSDEKLAQKLRKLANKNAGTNVAIRASFLAERMNF
ncbi:MAG: hypothetical protein QGH51_05180 [Planctomycetota bacterium]|nr:hypothetical protein [Planctomycetota bacterium]